MNVVEGIISFIWTCSTCGKEHLTVVEPSAYGQFAALPCTHFIQNNGMGGTGKAMSVTEYHYFHLPKKLTIEEIINERSVENV